MSSWIECVTSPFTSFGKSVVSNTKTILIGTFSAGALVGISGHILLLKHLERRKNDRELLHQRKHVQQKQSMSVHTATKSAPLSNNMISFHFMFCVSLFALCVSLLSSSLQQTQQNENQIDSHLPTANADYVQKRIVETTSQLKSLNRKIQNENDDIKKAELTVTKERQLSFLRRLQNQRNEMEILEIDAPIQ
jgi:hypothetical protein